MPPARRYKLVIFDFDDTIGHLSVQWSDVKRELVGWAQANGKAVNPKDHIIVISNKLSEEPDGKQEVVDVFNKYESECVRNETYLMFPSMVKLLREVKQAGYRVAIATGNNVKTVSDILEKEGLRDLVEFVCGMDMVRLSKPDPETLDVILKQLGVDRKDAVFIGNSKFDVMAGKAAGVKTIKIETLLEDDVTMLRELLLKD